MLTPVIFYTASEVWSQYLLPPSLYKHKLHGRRKLKTPFPKCHLYWSFLFGGVKQFCRFWTWSETECKTPAEYGLQHNSTPPPPATHCLYILYIYFGKGGRGGGEVREKVEGQQYTSIVPSSLGAAVHSWVENTNHEWMHCISKIC